jgi:hypothetical protein
MAARQLYIRAVHSSRLQLASLLTWLLLVCFGKVSLACRRLTKAQRVAISIRPGCGVVGGEPSNPGELCPVSGRLFSFSYQRMWAKVGTVSHEVKEILLVMGARPWVT